MKVLVYVLVFLSPMATFGQPLPIPRCNSSIILVRDTIAVDSLNALCLKSIEASVQDSSECYAIMAYFSASRLHYVHGKAYALSLLGYARTFFDGNLMEAEALDKAAVEEYANTSNRSGLGESLERLAFVCFAESKYDEALKYADDSYQYYKQIEDDTGVSHVLQLLTQIYLKRGEFDKAFDAGQRALQLSMKMKVRPEIKVCILGLGTVCMGIEDYSLALDYYRSVFGHFSAEDSLSLVKSEDLVWAKMEYAEIYSHLGKFDSALLRYNSFDTSGISEKDLRVFLVSKAEYFMLRHLYSAALPDLINGLAIHTRLNDGNEIVRTALDLSTTYFALQKTDSALRYARLGLVLASKSAARQRMRDAYKLHYLIFEGRNETDSAFYYYRRYIQTKESLTDDQTKGKFAAQEYVSRIALLSNDRQTNQQRLKFQDQLLKKQSLIRDILIALVLVVFIVSLLLFRNLVLKRKNERLINDHAHRELIHKTNEMEMQALRSQMNPHFIFNCLNSINRFILKNESQAASDYLTQFSRLVRLVLTNSKRAWIPLEEEIDMLRLYLDMEKLRFKDRFDYALLWEDDMDTCALFVPPLLLQPFVENAIWHGLMHKDGHGLVTVSFRMEGNAVLCSIEDDGVGRLASARANSKSSQAHKSLGIRITGERLALINRQAENDKVNFIIEDLKDRDGHAAGTRVCLRINGHFTAPFPEEIHSR